MPSHLTSPDHPLARLNHWIDRLISTGVTQCTSGSGLETLIGELQSHRGYRAITKRLTRLSGLFPRDQLLDQARGTSSRRVSGWGRWGGVYAQETSDRQLSLSHLSMVTHPRRDWVEEVIEELSAICVLIQMTERSDELCTLALEQHHRRLGIGPHRLIERHGEELYGMFISLGSGSEYSSTPQRQVQSWFLHVESGALLISRASTDFHERATPEALQPRGRVFWGRGHVLTSLSPRQILWHEVTLGPTPKHTPRRLLDAVAWSADLNAVLTNWRVLLARDPFAKRPLFAVRGVHVAARWEGDPSEDDSIISDVDSLKRPRAQDRTLPSIDTYLIDQRGLAARLYASPRDRWAMAKASADHHLMVIGAWGGKGFRPLVWSIDDASGGLETAAQAPPHQSAHTTRDLQLTQRLYFSTSKTHSPYRLSGLQGQKNAAMHPLQEPISDLLIERAERAQIAELYQERLERGVRLVSGADRELSYEIRRDLCALWLWRRADLPLCAPPLMYDYPSLLKAAQHTFCKIGRAEQTDDEVIESSTPWSVTTSGSLANLGWGVMPFK